MVLRARARQLLARYFEGPCARLLHSLKLTPNAVTVLGLAVTGGAAYLAARGVFWPAGLVLLFAGALDMLDGALARLTGRASRFGAALDSLADRVGEALLLFGLLLYYLGQDHQAGVVLVFLVMVASYLVSYLRARGEGLGITMKETGLGTRTERVVVIIIGLLTHSASLILVSLAVVLALSTFTSGQRLYHLWQGTRGE